MSIYLCSTHNLIHFKISKELNCFLYWAAKCQMMVANGGTINFFVKCHNITISMGGYVLNSPIISIRMGGIDVILRIQWLQSLGMINFIFQELFLKFFWEGKEFQLRGITRKPWKILISNGMTKLFKKEQWGVIKKLCTLGVQTSKSSISLDLQKVLDNHSKVFENPTWLPPIRDHDHVIHLVLGIFPPNIRPYKYPYAPKSEMKLWLQKC